MINFKREHTKIEKFNFTIPEEMLVKILSNYFEDIATPPGFPPAKIELEPIMRGVNATEERMAGLRVIVNATKEM